MKIKAFLITVVVLIVSIGSLFYLKHKQNIANQGFVMPEQVINVQAENVRYQAYTKTTALLGQAKATQHAVISNELAGKITKVNFASGQDVKQGQVLLELNHSEESALLKSAHAESQLNRQTLERYLILQKNGRISDDKVDLAQAQLAKSLAEIERISAIIDKKVIKAPFTGHIGIHDLSVGQYIDSNTQITDLVGKSDSVWVDFNVPQTYPKLTVNSLVTIIDKSSQARAQAKLVSIDPVLNHASRQAKYRSQLAIKDMNVKPNQLLKVEFPLTQSKEYLVVSQQAVVKDQLGNYVYVLNKEGDSFRAVHTKVELGDRIGQQVIVVSGIEQGALIASQGAFKLRSGVKVAITASEQAEK